MKTKLPYCPNLIYMMSVKSRSQPVKVLNIHQRVLSASAQKVGTLVDSLSSREDKLWPKQTWPRMAFDRPLCVGAIGGHSPVRYVVEAYTPGRSVKFRFTGPRGFNGYHQVDVVDRDGATCVIRHTLEMSTNGLAVLSWPIVFRPMHDALVEDALAQAQVSLGESPHIQKWSTWVRVLRWFISSGQARPQMTSNL